MQWISKAGGGASPGADGAEPGDLGKGQEQPRRYLGKGTQLKLTTSTSVHSSCSGWVGRVGAPLQSLAREGSDLTPISKGQLGQLVGMAT